MNQQKSAFLNQILNKRFELESQRWFATLSQRFDVALVCSSAELYSAVLVFLNRKLGLNDPDVLADTPALKCIEVSPTDRQGDQRLSHPTPLRPSQCLYVCCGEAPKGTGAILFELPALENLLPSPATMVSTLLANTGLERFVDAFDGARMTSLKKVLERYGLDVFFDCVVQTAYLGGYKGDVEAADRRLEQLLKPPNESEGSPQKSKMLPVQHGLSFEGLIEQLLRHPEPHDVLKAALAHYAFHRKNVSQAEASRLLKISRSTLQAHLQMAERLKVHEYFRFENPSA